MKFNPATSPSLYLARANGWAWLYEERGITVASPEYGDLAGGRFQDAVRALTGQSDLDLSEPARFESLGGGTVYALQEGETPILVVQQTAARETAELALSATHELANALSAISGWAHLGLSEPTKTFDALQTIERASAAAQRVARDVISFRQDMNLESCEAAAVCRDVASLLHPIALRHDVRVDTDTPSLAWTTAHRAAVFRVIWNLALNATQVQPKGGSVLVRCLRDDEQIRIVVSDKGPGIEDEKKARIFEPRFSMRPGGTGYGLATVKRTIEEVGGAVSLESRAGGGTSFQVTLPRAKEEEDRRSGVVVGRLPKRILVVEDDHGVRELIETTLGLRGIDVITAVDASSARRVMGNFDVAVADLTLPDGRGDTLLAELRAEGRVSRTVVTSGQLDPGTLIGPPDAWLPKPFDILDLLAVLREDAARSQAATGS